MKIVANLIRQKLLPLNPVVRDELKHRIEEVQAHHASIARRLESVTAERDDLLKHKEHEWNSRHMARILHHLPWRLAGESAVVANGTGNRNDIELVKRVAAAYQSAVLTPVGSTKSIWLNEFAKANEDTHATLMNDDLDAIAAILRNPATTMIFYGFDSIQAQDAPKNNEPFWRAWHHRLTYDSLLQLSRAVGARRVENPEAHIDFDDAPEVESLLTQLDDRFGFKIDFPNLFVGEIGLKTSRGIANYRAAQSLYQAWRIASLIKNSTNPRVLEIGAGLGRTAYYATQMGVSDYTIVDIPLTGVAQGYYLGSVLGETKVSLWGEDRSAPVRILPPVAYTTLDERFDLIANFDSLTEMAQLTAEQYLHGAARLTDRFLSVNHEHNAFTVESIYRDMRNAQAWRAPCWVRRGYVEELIQFKGSV